MAAGAEGGSGGGMLSGVQDALTGAFSGGKMSNASIADQRKFAGDSITKAFDAFGAMQPNAATGKATSTPSALPNCEQLLRRRARMPAAVTRHRLINRLIPLALSTGGCPNKAEHDRR